MRQSSGNIVEPPTRLQQDLLARIVALIHEGVLAVGARLNEHQLALRLGVSRSPLRAALGHLADQGVVVRDPNRGTRLIRAPDHAARRTADLAQPGTADADELLVRIAADRGRGLLAADISQAALARRYGLARATVRAALDRLADLDMVERKRGYGWRFVDTLSDAAARAESYRFRITIETAAILEPGFCLDPGWAHNMRTRHEQALVAAWTSTSSVAFYEMNAAFHEGIAAASGNRYLHTAVQRQNRLRRLSNYHWKHGPDRVQINCREHLDILTRLEEGAQDVAAALMRRHLEVASRLSPSFIDAY